MNNLEIRIATIEDLNGVVDSTLRHFKEPGFNNLPSHPYGTEHIFDRHEYYQDYLKKFSTKIDHAGWGRTFVITYKNEVKAYLNFHNNSQILPHTVCLGMGLEMELRGQKLGPKLLELGVEWIKENTKVQEIILYVFAHNLPAIKIYERAGFKIVHEIKNRFEIDGLNIDDLTMKLTIVR